MPGTKKRRPGKIKDGMVTHDEGTCW
jgi:hypothetical protein